MDSTNGLIDLQKKQEKLRKINEDSMVLAGMVLVLDDAFQQ